MSTFAHTLPFGAQLLPDGRTLFRLWAPSQARVVIEIDGRDEVSMRRRDGGWFEAQADVGAGAQYCYRLPSGLHVPDPAARAQADDVHGRSLVVNPRSYRWRTADWRGRPWRDAVL